MTRMTRPDCAVMCNLINTHTHTHTVCKDTGDKYYINSILHPSNSYRNICVVNSTLDNCDAVSKYVEVFCTMDGG